MGILGTGQLGRMLALAARRMGVRVITHGDEAEHSPCGQVAEPVADLGTFLRRADVVTTEFENVDVAVLAAAKLARPSGQLVGICQNRGREKAFLRAEGLPTVAHQLLDIAPGASGSASSGSGASLRQAIVDFGLPAVLKTAAFGYDGKGQWVLRDRADLDELDAIPANAGPFVVEALVDLALELSVVVARGGNGEAVCYPVMENRHRHHILDVSLAPAGVDAELAGRAQKLALQIAEALTAVGVLCVEFFVTTSGELLVNEIAPRPHNSGHLTIEAAPSSQFDQQLRAVCGLPLGAVAPFRPAAMANLLGELWAQGEPNWAHALAVPGVTLHLYGKDNPRPGRKMGHLTAVASTPHEALELVLDARHRLGSRPAPPPG